MKQDIFGFRYKLKNGIITIGKEEGLIANEYAGIIEIIDEEILLDSDDWTKFQYSLCENYENSKEFKLVIYIRTYSLESFVMLDDFGPCSFYYTYDIESNGCYQNQKLSAQITIEDLSGICSVTAIKGSLMPFNEKYTMTQQYIVENTDYEMSYFLTGVKRMNGYGDRKFLVGM